MPSYSGVWTLVQQLQATAAGNWQRSPLTGDVGVFSLAGGALSYVQIATTGNSIDYGDLPLINRSNSASFASATVGFWAGGAVTDKIQSVNIANGGSATIFGDLLSAMIYLAGCNNSTRGVIGGGDPTGIGPVTNVIQYVTMSSAGNATDFGDLTVARGYLGSCSSTTRGLFVGGRNSGGDISNVVDYITIASAGNATDFGDIDPAIELLANCSSSTRAISAGGRTLFSAGAQTNIIDYLTIASTGNSLDFGDLTVARDGLAAFSSSTRGVFACGRNTSSANTNVIDYVTIASTGNATDFGDATISTAFYSGCSNANGGL